MSAGDPREIDDPVEHFLQDIVYHGKSERTRAAYERVLRRFERHLESNGREDIGGATHRDCMAWIHHLRGTVSESTVATYAAYLHRFYAYMTQVGAFDSNPMTLVMEELDETIDVDPTRRDLSIPDMRTFVAGIAHPLDRAVVVTLLKTGIRVGELCNLDRRDLNLEPLLLDTESPPPRPALQGRPNSLYVDEAPARGSTHNGEQRTASNKRMRETVIPVDDELARVLGRWLAVRPDPRSPAHPLFCSTGDRWGARLTTDMAYHIVEQRAKDVGWYRQGGGAEENVTPHYFRHFFTTHLRDRTGDRGIVKYLRGDVATDVIDTYTHNWGDRVRDVYETNIYSLL
ncbi:MAG TPA: tyrosine-type recombinase/integrase [Natrialbaceae archaeon]|nr:tyrosine-type recombinase/integrase [Natrialbaceae archaeon]